MTKKVVSFGCRLNIYESAVIDKLSSVAKLDDVIFINTCAVTKEAERQAKQTIRKLYKKYPLKKIIVTGCSAQINPLQYKSMPEVSAVIGNDDKIQIETYKKILNGEKFLVSDINKIKNVTTHEVSSFGEKRRAFVEVQNGCNNRCSFCIVPYARGPARSVPISTIVKNVRHLIDKGFYEIVLTGVNLTSYGVDFKEKITLSSMIIHLLKEVPDLKRLRLSSLDLVEIDNDLLDLFDKGERLLPHMHLSIQSGDDIILKRMRRRHTRGQVIDFCKKIREIRPDVTLGADFIVGFPTETEKMFQNTYNLIDECNLSFLHVFPFSKRPGTPAFNMEEISKFIIKERAKRLREKGEEACIKLFKQHIGKKVSFLIESERHNTFLGKTDHFIPIIVKGNTNLPSRIACALVYDYTNKGLLGELV
ncbi:MAG: tRNA (N(6)-L-threonylcarbamoyladenosine(37)-C(2))-methylthiotransferase MtaB [Alphaproteobacteria bacterium]